MGRRIRLELACALALILPAAAATAQNFANKPINILMGFPAGSGLDVVARYYGNHLQRLTGQTVVVQNRLGANGTIAMGVVARAAPDGHTMLFGPGASAAHVVFKSLGFDPVKDVIPVAGVVAFPFFLIVSSERSKATTVAQLVEELQRKPGISWGSPTSLGNVGGALLSLRHGIKGVSVQYKSNQDAVRDLIAGDLDFMVNEASTSLAGIRDGRLRGLAVTLRQRTVNAPDIPTMTELGYSDYNFHGFMGVYLPAGTPGPIVAQLEAWALEIGRSQETAELYRKLGGDVFALDRKQFSAFEQSEFAAWKERARIARIEPQ